MDQIHFTKSELNFDSYANRILNMDAKHWNDIYENKSDREVSWFESVPTRSLELIDELQLQPNAKIIDIGAGNSRLVDGLWDKGFRNISVLDISEVAIEKAKSRLGEKAQAIKFLVTDVTKFAPIEKYNLWHDRATFHFLTTVKEIEAYLRVVDTAIAKDGFLIVSTFSKTGPEKCSGLPIVQYSDFDLKAIFEKYFINIRCFEDTHLTPWNSAQNFVYCGFKKR